MSIKAALRRALSAIETAERAAKRARSAAPNDTNAGVAIRELQTAESEIKRALVQLRDLDLDE